MRGLHIVILIVALGSFKAIAQQKDASNMELLRAKVSDQSAPHDKEKGLFGLYKNVFSDQILNDCIYDRSCSAFSKDVFQHFNPLKGLMLTVDRLTRCNRATYSQISQVLIDDRGRAYDHWDYYVKK